MEKVVFLDRDGTINIEKKYLFRIEDFQFINGTPEAIHLLNQNNYKVIVVTNQAGIARGYYSEDDVKKLHGYINDELYKYKAHIDYYFYCPHHPTEGIGKYKVNCKCRKPEIGMFQNAEKIFPINKKKSWMIGDNKNDIIAGNNFNINTILVSTGYGSSIYEQEIQGLKIDYYASDILEAVKYILMSKLEKDNNKLK